MKAFLAVMRKWFAELIFFFCASIPLVFAEDLPPDIARIQKRGKLVVAMYGRDTPPFFMKNKNGELFGVDVDIAKDIAQDLGVKVEFSRNYNHFDDAVEAVANHKADVAISDLSITLRRAARLRFSRPYLVVHHALLVNRLKAAQIQIRSSGDIPKLNQEGIAIGILNGASYVDYIQSDFPKASIKTFESDEELCKAVSEGGVAAAITDEPALRNWQFDNPKISLKIKALVIPDRNDALAIVTHWRDTQLLSWLNQYIEIMQRNGTLNKLKTQYLEEQEWRSRLP